LCFRTTIRKENEVISLNRIKLAILGCAWLTQSVAYSKEFQVGIVLDKGGKDDKSFNTSALEGARKAQKDLGVPFKFVESSDDHSFEPMLRSFAKKDFDLVFAIGFSQAEALQKVSKAFPKVKFAIVDAEVNAANVQSLMFEEHEGSYLVGALAALSSKSGKIGFIGGMDIPLIRRFLLGYESGAKKINPNVVVTSQFVGVTGDAWNNPTKAKELALNQFNQQVDVVFAAAGASGMGLFDAAAEKKKLAIGVDSNQNGIKPGTILTSMLKKVDEAVYSSIKGTKEGKFSPGTKRYGLADGGVDYAMDQHNEKLISKEMKAKVDDLKSQIVSKKISVPDFYKTPK
jgi:basic membrane protein A